eukprot:scaffold171509_cov33-Tisochrysis_lutea.AAC.5
MVLVRHAPQLNKGRNTSPRSPQVVPGWGGRRRISLVTHIRKSHTLVPAECTAHHRRPEWAPRRHHSSRGDNGPEACELGSGRIASRLVDVDRGDNCLPAQALQCSCHRPVSACWR